MDNKPDDNRSNINFLYFFTIGAVALALAVLFSIIVNHGISIYLLRCLQLLAYFVVGSVSLNFTKKRSGTDSQFSPGVIVKSVVIVLAVLVIFYIQTDTKQILIAFSTSAIFILPFVLSYNYNIYASIPSRQYKALPHPTNLVVEKAIIFVNSVTLKFKLRVSPEDKNEKIFATVVPAQMALGEIFKAFLIHQKNNNVLISQGCDDRREIGWIFFKMNLWGLYTRALDPALNLWDNKVKPGNIISVKRVAYYQTELVGNDKIITNGSN